MGATRRTPPVALVGFMGAGKSSVGRALAEALRLSFVDTDDLIVARVGSVDGIFAARGEPGFRRLEAEVVTAAVEAALERPCVLALGGGAVTSADVRAALGRLPHVVWLCAPPDVLWRRATSAGQAERPLARDEHAFRALLAEREPLYRAVATLTVDVAGDSPGEIAAGLARRLRAPDPAGGTGAASGARTTGGADVAAAPHRQGGAR